MSVSRHTMYNLVGTAVPLVLAIVTVPAYLKLIGNERYGILAIAWLILGYFGLFDLGLGRATTQRIAALRDASQDERETAFSTALVANVAIGFAGAAILWPVAWYMFAHGMKLSSQLRAEMVPGVPLLALAVPVATTIGVMSGALMGRARFLQTNRISVLSTSLFQLFPLFIAWRFGPNLAVLLVASIAARLVALILLYRACSREFGGFSPSRFDRRQLRALLAFGGWVTLTAMFGPLLVVTDRFAIGIVLGAAAVTVYVVPMQLTARLSNVAQAMTNALFPRLAMADGDEAKRLGHDGMAVLMALLTPPVAAAVILMQPALSMWVGTSLGTQAAPIGRILLVAYWLNCFAHLPYVTLESRGRPDLITKVLFAELPFYLGGLFVGLHFFGLQGAAWVYLTRVAIDHVALNFVASRRIDHAAVLAALLSAFIVLLVALDRIAAPSVIILLACAAGAGLAYSVIGWALLPAGPRRTILGLLDRFGARRRAVSGE